MRSAAKIGLFFTFICMPIFAQAATITVSSTADNVTNDANCTLREAVIAANTDAAYRGCTAGSGTDTISVPAGTYTLALTGPNENAAATGDLDITANASIQGATAATTIINGGAIDRVFHLPNSGITLTLNNLTVRNGNVPTGGPAGDGGGGTMVGLGATLIVSNCVFRDNLANQGNAEGGGGVDSRGNFTITNSEFYSNTSYNDGAIRCLGTCTGSVTDTVIRNNLATSYVGGGLGAAGNLALLRVQVLDNVSTGVGGAGGLSCLQEDGQSNVITVTDSVFRGNSATALGGGIAIFTITTVFTGAANVTITNTTISGNSSNGPGGGLYVRVGTAQLNNVTITNNTADSDNNDAGNQGGGIYRTSGTVNIRNSLVSGNIDMGGTASTVDCTGTISSGGYNLVHNGSTCAFNATGDQTSVDPLLSALADNGSGRQTHAFSLSSPALNAGNPAGCAGPSGNLTADQRGITRPQGARCDIGAYEFSCGFGTTDAVAGETCDDGNNTTETCSYGQTSCSVCSSTCQTQAGTVSYCGDGVVQGGNGETCDDSNTVTETCAYGAGACTVCDSSCHSVAGAQSSCGDGVVQAGNGETCDDSNTVTEACAYGSANCTVCAGNCTSVAGAVSSCGDGIIQMAFEDCDDSNDETENCDYGETQCTVCDETCANGDGNARYCGDGVVQLSFGEACDEGGDNGVGSCAANCQLTVEGSDVEDTGDPASEDPADPQDSGVGDDNGSSHASQDSGAAAQSSTDLFFLGIAAAALALRARK